jgi:hypothetical protein
LAFGEREKETSSHKYSWVRWTVWIQYEFKGAKSGMTGNNSMRLGIFSFLSFFTL